MFANESMVQFRTSLEVLVLQAWRERWSELEWSVNLKAAIEGGCDHINQLCRLILKQATLSEEPNQLMFKYLNYSIAAKVVSHTSLLEATIEYKDFGKELCMTSILETLTLIRDRLRPDGLDAYNCNKVCSLVRSLFSWFLDGVSYCLNAHRRVLLAILVNNCMNFIRNDFITLCLYFDQLENTDEFNALFYRFSHQLLSFDQSEWVNEAYKSDFRTLTNRFYSVKVLENITDNNKGDICTSESSCAYATVISVAALYGSLLLAEPLYRVVDTLKTVQEIQKLCWPRLLRDFIRGALLLQQDLCWPIPESHMTAFAYLRVPRVLKELLEQNTISTQILQDSLTQLSHYHALFNALDMRSRCDCFQYFLSELLKQNLITKNDFASLLEMRNADKTTLSDTSPGSQASVSLVLKAEPTLQTLLKSFHSEFAQKQDKLVQMMHHMISGKSFEFICAAAAATERLGTFAGKLVDFNEASKKAAFNTEKPEETLLRSELFDLSFLLLSRIFQLYTCRPFRFCSSNVGSFFLTWCSSYVENASSFESLSDDNFPGASHYPIKEENDSYSQVDVSEMWIKLKASQGNWINDSDWSSVCNCVPKLGQKLLSEIKEDIISAEEFKNVFSGLLCVNVNGAHWMCSILLCLAQWLVTCNKTEERKKCAMALSNFIDSMAVGERNKLSDRQTFMANVTKRLLAPLLTPDPVPFPPYPWLNGYRKAAAVSPASAANASSPDAVRHQFGLALRQGWLTSATFIAIDRYNQLRQSKVWIKVWIEELHKLSSTEEMNLWSELCLACCHMESLSPLLCFVDVISNFVFEPGRELFCVSPRGTTIAKLLVQMFILALRNAWKSDAVVAIGSDNNSEPARKVRKIELEQSQEVIVKTEDGAVVRQENSVVFNLLKSLFGRFLQISQLGDITPALFFVTAFLRNLSTYNCAETKFIKNEIPPNMINAIIRNDPEMLSSSTIMALHNLQDKESRRSALQSVFLLRQLRMV